MQFLQLFDYYIRDPTPDGVDLLPGIPKFPRYERHRDEYLTIDKDWRIQTDYSSTWTISVDEQAGNKKKPVH